MQIAILIYDGFTALDAVGPYEVLSRLPKVQVVFVAKEKRTYRTDTDMLGISADYTLNEITQPDMLLVPGGVAGTFAAANDEVIVNWVRHAHQTSTWTISVCTGSLILGAAGILKGLKATTHWAVKDRLKDYGAEYVEERYIQNGKIITAAGVSAGIDMALFLTSQIEDDTYAKVLQLGIEYDPQPPFDSGSMSKASPKVRAISLASFAASLAKEHL